MESGKFGEAERSNYLTCDGEIGGVWEMVRINMWQKYTKGALRIQGFKSNILPSIEFFVNNEQHKNDIYLTISFIINHNHPYILGKYRH